MTETISELRKICQETREDGFYQMGWIERNVVRKISIYLTVLFLRAGISANRVTLLNGSTVMIAGALFAFAEPGYWLGALLLSAVYFVLDCADGEVARYRRISSVGGQYLDAVLGQVRVPYLISCMTFGLYNSLRTPVVFVFGFLAVLAVTSFTGQYLRLQIAAYREGLRCGTDTELGVGKEPAIVRYTRILYQILFNTPFLGFLPQLFVATIVDCVVPSFTIASRDFNVRLVYLVALSLAHAGALMVRTYLNVVRYGKVKPEEAETRDARPLAGD